MEPDSAAVQHDAAHKQRPVPGEQVLVRCPGFQCLANRDAEGTWRSVFGNRELPEVLKVISGADGKVAPPTSRDGIDRLLDQVDRLPPAPRVLPRLLSALSEVETDISQVVDLVAVDAVLTAKVLQTCNSAYFGTSQTVKDVSEAVHRLGFQMLYRIVAMVSGANCFKFPQPGTLDVDRLWGESVTAAFGARFIAEDVGLDSSLLFTAGILHDFGKVVLAGARQGATALLVGGTVEDNDEALKWERTTYGFGHAEIGGRVLERWGFGEQLVASVRYHHDPGMGGEAARFAACVSLADTLAHRLNDTPVRESVTSPESRAALNILGLAEEQLTSYDDRIKENLQFVEGMCRI
jgi:HD-like signal output (HDOD) protein